MCSIISVLTTVSKTRSEMEEIAKEQVAVVATTENVVDMELKEKEVEMEQVPDEVKITTDPITLELTPTKAPSPPPPAISTTNDDTESTDMKLVPLSETETEEDIVCLDDESDSESGVSDSKRPRKEGENGEGMEIDEKGGVMSKVDKDSVAKLIKRMKRSDLEDLVLAKCVEAVVAHTELGHLRQKVLEMQQQKDKMAGKMGIMMKQVNFLNFHQIGHFTSIFRGTKKCINFHPFIIS